MTFRLLVLIGGVKVENDKCMMKAKYSYYVVDTIPDKFKRMEASGTW